MDALTVAAFEQRAAEAEARLSLLELKLSDGAAPAPSSAANVAELQALRDLLVQAREATVKLQAEKDAALADNLKLKYQVKHLKKAVVEGDEKIAKAGL